MQTIPASLVDGDRYVSAIRFGMGQATPEPEIGDGAADYGYAHLTSCATAIAAPRATTTSSERRPTPPLSGVCCPTTGLVIYSRSEEISNWYPSCITPLIRGRSRCAPMAAPWVTSLVTTASGGLPWFAVSLHRAAHQSFHGGSMPMKPTAGARTAFRCGQPSNSDSATLKRRCR